MPVPNGSSDRFFCRVVSAMASMTPPPMRMTAMTPMVIHSQGSPGESLPVASRLPVSLSTCFHVAVFPERVPSPETRETLPGKVTETSTLSYAKGSDV